MTDDELSALSADIGQLLKERGASVTTAESCTGGWIAKVITDTAGSSAWFERGFVTYSNQAKESLTGVQAVTLQRHGAVSEAVVREMAQGALVAAQADYALSVSGIAGPGGGNEQCSTGTVWFGLASAGGKVNAWRQHFTGDREQVRRQATAWALQMLRREIPEK